MRSFLGVPLHIRGEVFGNLYLTEKRGAAEFDEEDETVLRALAAAAAVSIENARLYEGTRRGIRGLVIPRDSSMSGQIFATGEAEEIRDFSRDNRVAEAARVSMTLGPALFVPLGGNEVRGVLTVGRRAGGMPFPDTVLGEVGAFAGQLGVALELAERRRDAERLTVYEDRDRIARDLHDLVIQRLDSSASPLRWHCSAPSTRACRKSAASMHSPPCSESCRWATPR